MLLCDGWIRIQLGLRNEKISFGIGEACASQGCFSGHLAIACEIEIAMKLKAQLHPSFMAYHIAVDCLSTVNRIGQQSGGDDTKAG